MNPTLSVHEVDARLEILERALVQILAAGSGNAARAEDIADARHNMPRLLREGHRWA